MVLVRALVKRNDLGVSHPCGQLMLGSYPAMCGKVFKQPADGHEFHPGTFRFPSSIMLPSVV